MTEIGAEARKHNPRLEGLAPFIGTWTTEGSHRLMPGRVLKGRTSFAWHEGGAFVIMHSEIDAPEVPSGVALFGSDDGDGIVMIYFDARGVSRHYRVTIEAGTMRWARDDAKISQRMTFTPNPEGPGFVLTGEMSENGGAWQGDLALSYRPE